MRSGVRASLSLPCARFTPGPIGEKRDRSICWLSTEDRKIDLSPFPLFLLDMTERKIDDRADIYSGLVQLHKQVKEGVE